MSSAAPPHHRSDAAASCCVLFAMVSLALPACGSENPSRQPTAPRSATRNIDALITKLTAAGPQGSVTPKQAATTAKRQRQIVQNYAGAVSGGQCKTFLQRLATSYGNFARAATTPADGATYGAAAQEVSTSLQAAERSCATDG
jgi:hypothetical protein